MDSDNLYDKVYEVKKEINVENTMQLIDLNGTKKNFLSEFIFQTEDPSKKVNICVLNQEELDNGMISFEESNRGKYSKRITFQSPQNEHLNHYIAVKKHPQDKDENPIKAYLVIHMKELPPLPSKDYINLNNLNNDSNNDSNNDLNNDLNNHSNNDLNNPENNTLNPNISENTRQSLKYKLTNLRTDNQYKKLKSGIQNAEEDDITRSGSESFQDDIILNEYENENEEDDEDKREKLKLLNERKKRQLYTNSYFIIGILMLALFACLFYMKKLRK